MRKSKYVGKTYDGRWLIISTFRKGNRTFYNARNIFNNNMQVVDDVQMSKLENEEINFGHIIRKQLFNEGKYGKLTISFRKEMA